LITKDFEVIVGIERGKIKKLLTADEDLNPRDVNKIAEKFGAQFAEPDMQFTSSKDTTPNTAYY
jgi:hypothetical protein